MPSTGRRSSDEIQFLYERRETLSCQMCDLDLFKLTEEQRVIHYDNHLSGEPPAEASTSAIRPLSKSLSSFSGLKRKRDQSDTKDAFWHSAQSDPPPHNFTPGLIHVIRKALLKAHAKSGLEKAYLCSNVAVHVATEPFDRGWGCGYRNFLMACSALMGQQLQPLYFPLLDDPTPPGVRNLQRCIEDAWVQGYDKEGAQQLKGKLVDTNKWIGTAELYVAFTSRSIPACLVDFDLNKRGVDALVQWIVQYFTQDPPKLNDINEALRVASPVVVTDRMPIVLQHAGHSRTVIGFERNQGKISLLMFDPSRRVPLGLRNAALSKAESSNMAETATNTHNQHHVSPKKIIKRVLHPHGGGGNTPNDKIMCTREEDVIIVDSDSDEPDSNRRPLSNVSKGIDLTKVLPTFRVSVSNLAKKDRYQILYFPMTAPLTDQERLSRKVVTSKKIS